MGARAECGLGGAVAGQPVLKPRTTARTTTRCGPSQADAAGESMLGVSWLLSLSRFVRGPSLCAPSPSPGPSLGCTWSRTISRICAGGARTTAPGAWTYLRQLSRQRRGFCRGTLGPHAARRHAALVPSWVPQPMPSSPPSSSGVAPVPPSPQAPKPSLGVALQVPQVAQRFCKCLLRVAARCRRGKQHRASGSGPRIVYSTTQDVQTHRAPCRSCL
jgi:hypothetical protein